jgi:hypothetical protein
MKKWQTALGEVKKFSELDHQHLSNILWFNEVLNGWTRKDKVQIELEFELMKRFNGVRLLWKPLPLPSCRNLQDQTEIYWIKKFASIDKQGRIIWKENVIGDISHIWNL